MVSAKDSPKISNVKTKSKDGKGTKKQKTNSKEAKPQNTRIIIPKSTQEIKEQDQKALSTIVDYFDQLDSGLKENITEIFEKSRPESENVRKCTVENYPNVHSFFEAIGKMVKGAIGLQPFLTKDENLSFRLWHLHLLEDILNLIKKNVIDSTPTLRLVKVLEEIKKDIALVYKNFSASEVVNYFTSNQAENFLQERYDQICEEELGVRAMNFKTKFIPSYKDVVPYFDKPLSEYKQMCDGHTMAKTLAVIYQMVQKFRQEILSRYERFAQPEKMRLYKVQVDYPFLNQTQCLFEDNYINEYHRRPLFYLIYFFFRTIAKRDCVFFCLKYGFYDGIEHSKKDIADLFSITGERVRQIIKKCERFMEGLKVSNEETNLYKQMLDSNIVTEDSELFRQIVTQEHLPHDFAVFSAIYSLVTDYNFHEAFGHKALMSPKIGVCKI